MKKACIFKYLTQGVFACAVLAGTVISLLVTSRYLTILGIACAILSFIVNILSLISSYKQDDKTRTMNLHIKSYDKAFNVKRNNSADIENIEFNCGDY